ncbi:hypothetical protein L6452_43418 [Arctium lappa]|uniref:Uncharacterized protein n=1 Tax=Arctium lappa TaxID=4217 RepID=A0ACB8XGP8_ARCLA|nr:hypothetical protein L6452_43418 [Arctium lappa]
MLLSQSSILFLEIDCVPLSSFSQVLTLEIPSHGFGDETGKMVMEMISYKPPHLPSFNFFRSFIQTYSDRHTYIRTYSSSLISCFQSPSSLHSHSSIHIFISLSLSLCIRVML